MKFGSGFAPFRFLTPFSFVFLGASVTPPVRGSDILSVRLRRIPSKSFIQRLNLQCRFSRSQIPINLNDERVEVAADARHEV